MRNMKKVLSLMLASVMILSLAAYGGKTATPETTAAPDAATTAADKTTAAETKEASGTFNIAVCLAPEPQSIDPALNSAVDGGIMINHFFEGLAKRVDDGSGNAILAPGQAESWEKKPNDDGTATYILKMRDGIKWSDDKPVTADDFVYSWRCLAKPGTTADYTYMIDMVKGYAEIAIGEADAPTLAVTAIDDKTLEVVLTYDCPYFEEVLAFPATYPVHEDMAEGNDQWVYDVNTCIGNGPYKVSEWSHNAYVMGVENGEHYDHDKLGPDSIKFTLLDDANTILAVYKSGEIDFIKEVPTDEIPNYLASDELTIVNYIDTYYAYFNTEDEIFKDPLVRKAFTLAIDRNYIVNSVTQTGQAPATGFVLSGTADAEGASGNDFRTVGGEHYSVKPGDHGKNCEEARALFVKTGYPNGEGFLTVEYLYNANDRHKAVDEALQNMWQEVLGVTVTLNNQSWNVSLENRKQGNYQISRSGWAADYNDPVIFLDIWYTDSGNNNAQYSRAERGAVINAAKVTSVPAERMKAMHKAKDILTKEDNVLYPLYFYTQKYMLNDRVDGMCYTPFEFFYFGNCTEK